MVSQDCVVQKGALTFSFRGPSFDPLLTQLRRSFDPLDLLASPHGSLAPSRSAGAWPTHIATQRRRPICGASTRCARARLRDGEGMLCAPRRNAVLCLNASLCNVIQGRMDASAQPLARPGLNVSRRLVKKSMVALCSPLNDRSSTVELRGEPYLGSFRSSS